MSGAVALQTVIDVLLAARVPLSLAQLSQHTKFNVAADTELLEVLQHHDRVEAQENGTNFRYKVHQTL